MIELPVTFKMLSDLQSGTIDVVRADACKAYGDQRAAEAREQMREECIAICDSHAESCEEMGDMLGMKTADRIADEIKELE